MNRRNLFTSTAKAAFASVIGGSWLGSRPTSAQAQVTRAQRAGAGPPQVSVLPYPDPQFKGVIGRTTEDSKPDFPQPVSAPEGAPNVLLILTDDVGFAAELLSAGDRRGDFPEAESNARAHTFCLSSGRRSHPRRDRADSEECVLHDHRKAQRS